jgi:hypothetical protein
MLEGSENGEAAALLRRPRQARGREGTRENQIGSLDLDHFRSMQAEPFDLGFPGRRGSAAASRDLAPS